MFDMIIRQGLILDGTAAPGKVADLGIVGDQIAAIGDLSGESAKQEIDARGKVVTPGFIDPHSHSDLSVLFEPSMTILTVRSATNCTAARSLIRRLRFRPIRPILR